MRMRSASYPTTTKCSSASASASAPSSPAKKATAAARVPKFLRCLYDILHNEDQAILSWSKDGSHFQIYSTKRLEVEILPKYFKHGKFASFQRQLNNFGFRKWTKTQSNVCTFSHHHYVRRHPQQLVELVVLQNESVPKPEVDSATKPPTLGQLHGKRKRSESSSDATKSTSTKAMKREPTSQRSARLPQIKVDAAAFEFEVESWRLVADIRPLEWAAKSRVASIKMESGNETPTSTAGFADAAFDFTLEELDDLLLTGATCGAGEDDDHIDVSILNECYGVEPPLSWVDYPELFGKSELELYMQDTELWASH